MEKSKSSIFTDVKGRERGGGRDRERQSEREREREGKKKEKERERNTHTFGDLVVWGRGSEEKHPQNSKREIDTNKNLAIQLCGVVNFKENAD